jgi:tRNA(fMet)-specific endonuclease VapC
MILLDTDHITVLMYHESERCLRLTERLRVVTGETIGTTVVNVEEQMRGWLASVARERKVRRQVPAYRELAGLFQFFSAFHIAPFDDAAAAMFEVLRTTCRRLATMDLKIAAVALVNNALLLTANASDFGQVPGLRFENRLGD